MKTFYVRFSLNGANAGAGGMICIHNHLVAHTDGFQAISVECCKLLATVYILLNIRLLRVVVWTRHALY